MRSTTVLLVSFLSSISFTSACLYRRDSAQSKYTYSGFTGPVAWHHLDPKNTLCATGKNQSPINILNSNTKQLAGKLKLNYPAESGKFTVENKGTTILFTPNGISKYDAVLDEKKYKLLQFHFHTPSEHFVNNTYYPMEVHFVHQAEGMSHPPLLSPSD